MFWLLFFSHLLAPDYKFAGPRKVKDCVCFIIFFLSATTTTKWVGRVSVIDWPLTQNHTLLSISLASYGFFHSNLTHLPYLHPVMLSVFFPLAHLHENFLSADEWAVPTQNMLVL